MLTPDVQDVPQGTSRAPAPKASIRSATISAPGATPISRCCKAVEGDEEHQRRQDRRYICAQTRSRPSWATSSSARTANGPSPECCRCSITASRATTLDQFKGMDTQTVVTPGEAQDRQRHLSVREGADSNLVQRRRRAGGRTTPCGAVLLTAAEGLMLLADEPGRLLSAARLADRPRQALEAGAARARRISGSSIPSMLEAGAGRRDAAGDPRPGARRASTSSPTASSGAKAIPTGSPPRSTASTSTIRAPRSTAAASRFRCRA